MTTCSMTFEIVERFAAALAAPQRLAGGRAEFRQHLGIPGAALRARHLLHAEQRAAGVRGLRRPSSLIQSVVQAGDSTVRTFELRKPSRSSASSISSVIMFIAGQPE